MEKIIVALGGNALGNDPKEQEELTRQTARSIVDLVEAGKKVIVSHGNGPQVGMINQALEENSIPFPECIAMSQGYIGYHLQKAILEELNLRQIKKNVSTVVTQVLIDQDDPSLKEPKKPIGAFYSEEEAKKIAKEKSYTMKNDSNRGWRRFISSPKPLDIVEIDTIRDLYEEGHIVIAGGGGGVPVVREGQRLRGVSGVIDKDFTTALIGELLGVDRVLILTAVEKVAINFGKEDQEDLSELRLEDAKKYIEEGQFGLGSMLPKIEASLKFIEANPGKKAIITDLENAREALEGRAGTIIY